MNDLYRFGISLEKQLIDAFDHHIEKQNYRNRSEAIRDLIRKELSQKIVAEGGTVAGAYGLIRKGMPLQEAQEKAIATLDKLGAKGLAERSPFQLSHGQRQRIALAGALVTNPAVILLDEPSSALDPRGRISLADALRSISSSILIATHDVEFASRTCNRFLVLCEQGLRECRNCSDAEAFLMGNVSVKSVGENPH